MYIFGLVVQSIVSVIIAIGDFVTLIISAPLKFITSDVKVRKKTRSGTFKLPRAKKKTRGFFLTPFSRLFRRAAHLLIFPILRLSAHIFSAPIRLYSSYQATRRASYIKKIARKKRLAKLKNNGYKPTLAYKLKYVFIGIIFSFLFFFLPLIVFLFLSELPNPSNLSVSYIPKTTKIYDRHGTLLYEIFANQNRTIVKLADVPRNLVNATIAIEDKDFYSHPGFDLRGIIRAFVTNVKKEGFQGGSTITQQLIKSAFLTSDPTIIRKIKEVALAFWAERIYSKNEILELYLNYVPYGGTAWGIQAAADIYFGKKVSDLNLAESAFLAGLTRAPSVYSPYFGNGKQWRARQKEVLDAMVRLHYVSKKEAEDAYLENLVFRDSQIPIKAPHFVMYVRNLLIDRYGLSEVERGGLQVVTSLDLPLQEEIERIVAEEVDADTYLNIGNGAALITDPKNGDILAMVGSKNYFDETHDGNVNLTTSLRQPGSAIKIVTYSLALSQGYTEATILDDSPLTIASEGGPSYTPVNYDGAFHGKIPLRTAFANSFNIPPVRIAQKLGPKAIKDFGETLGISSWNNVKNYGISITLGGVEIKMTDLATAYGTIANEGKKVRLDPIDEVKDSYGETVYKKTVKATQVVDPRVAFILADILADNNARIIEFGLNTPLNIPGARVSVKTGTTDNKRDNWTIGFTRDFLAATWVGNNDNTPMNQSLASGITGAAPMWNKIMTMLIDKIGTPEAIIIPSNIVKKFCLGQDRYFVKGTENSVNCRFMPPSPTPSP